MTEVLSLDVFVKKQDDDKTRSYFGVLLTAGLLVGLIVYSVYTLTDKSMSSTYATNAVGQSVFYVNVLCDAPTGSATNFTDGTCFYAYRFSTSSSISASVSSVCHNQSNSVPCGTLSRNQYVTLPLCYSDDPQDGLIFGFFSNSSNPFGIQVASQLYAPDTGTKQTLTTHISYGQNALISQQMINLTVSSDTLQSWFPVNLNQVSTASLTGHGCTNYWASNGITSYVATSQLRIWPLYTTWTVDWSYSITGKLGEIGGAFSAMKEVGAVIVTFYLILISVRNGTSKLNPLIHKWCGGKSDPVTQVNNQSINKEAKYDGPSNLKENAPTIQYHQPQVQLTQNQSQQQSPHPSDFLFPSTSSKHRSFSATNSNPV